MQGEQLKKITELYNTQWAYITGPWKPGEVYGIAGKEGGWFSHVPGVIFAKQEDGEMVYVNDFELLLGAALSDNGHGEAIVIYDYLPEYEAIFFRTVSSMSFTGWLFKTGECEEGGYTEDGHPFIYSHDENGICEIRFTAHEKLPWFSS